MSKEEDIWEAFDRVLKQFPDDALKELHYDVGQQFHHLEVEIIDLKAQLKESKSKAIEDFILELKKLVDEQAEDEALWCVDVPITEAYHQQELRKLHALIEKYAKDYKNGTKDAIADYYNKLKEWCNYVPHSEFVSMQSPSKRGQIAAANDLLKYAEEIKDKI